MTTKIGLLSDVHATPAPVKDALSIFRKEGVDLIVCAGDIAGYGNELDGTVELLIESGCTAILGNHDLWYLEDTVAEGNSRSRVYLGALPDVLDLLIEGKKVYVVHASPPRSYTDGIKLLDEGGEIIQDRKVEWTQRLAGFEHDVLVVGHTHQVFAEPLGGTLLINPGSSKFNHTCAVLQLPGLKLQVFSLSNKTPVKAWNWGGNQIESNRKTGR